MPWTTDLMKMELGHNINKQNPTPVVYSTVIFIAFMCCWDQLSPWWQWLLQSLLVHCDTGIYCGFSGFLQTANIVEMNCSMIPNLKTIKNLHGASTYCLPMFHCSMAFATQENAIRYTYLMSSGRLFSQMHSQYIIIIVQWLHYHVLSGHRGLF